MPEVVWRPRAEQDLQEIIYRIWQDNPNRAFSFAQEIQSKAASLCQFPLRYRAGRLLGTREMVLHPNYLLIYRVKDNIIEILRIKHARMQG